MAFIKINNCLACGSNKLRNVLNLNKQPLANSYLKNLKTEEKKYELKVNACLNCSHLQLSIAVDPKKIYKNYDYLSGTTKTYLNYMEEFYNFCIKKSSKFVFKNILDIGCNDGSQLDVFKRNNFKTFGIDPAKNIFKISSKKHKIYCDFFNKKIVKKINKKFDLIIFQNSFAHNPNPYNLLLDIKKLMHDKSTLIIQTSQADMCKNKEFDTVYHEHINFFNINSMNQLTKRAKLTLHDVVKKSIHGTSYLFVIKPSASSNKIKKLLINESYLNYSFYKKWGNYCSVNIKKIQKKIKEIKKKEIIIGYGAAAKANTFLNFSKINLDFVIDDNKFKQNKYCPGSKIPIKSGNLLKKINNDLYILPLAWNFYNEIKARVKKLRPKKNDKFILCFPHFKIEK
ncbi:methyltransferase domain-containing protein [Pelagibacterales bacterium SAG-MED47]|nr:methyltransferase domain-containing protein [Pelagibacterales bacterium SAG-MED47]